MRTRAQFIEHMCDLTRTYIRAKLEGGREGFDCPAKDIGDPEGADQHLGSSQYCHHVSTGVNLPGDIEVGENSAQKGLTRQLPLWYNGDIKAAMGVGFGKSGKPGRLARIRRSREWLERHGVRRPG